MARKIRFNTKLEIIRYATHVILTKGFSHTSIKDIAKELNISTGNITYHFQSKEHLLAELTRHLCEYHRIILDQEVDEGRTSLLAYCMELTSMMAVCEENEVAKDLYTSVYKHPMTLKLLREADTEKIKHIFAEFCPDWDDEDFALTENAVSGIEYASLMKENAENVPLDRRIVKTLRVVMKAYNVPEDIREQKIQKVLAIDYRRIGKRFIEGFTQYIEDYNERALKSAESV